LLYDRRNNTAVNGTTQRHDCDRSVEYSFHKVAIHANFTQ